MSDLLALYQEVILDHNKSPRNFGELPDPEHRAEGNNPLCGDRLTVDLLLDGGRIVDVRFRGQGCAISLASASLMTEAVKGRTLEEANALFEIYDAHRGAVNTGEDHGNVGFGARRDLQNTARSV